MFGLIARKLETSGEQTAAPFAQLLANLTVSTSALCRVIGIFKYAKVAISFNYFTPLKHNFLFIVWTIIQSDPMTVVEP